MKPKILTNAQAIELKWFCKNVAGVRTDLYPALESVRGFDERIRRLEKTCQMIEKYLGEEIKEHAAYEGTEE